MKKKSNITFIIFAFNEEKRIEYPIRCFLPNGDVIVSDDSSTDNTAKIAKKLGAKIIKRKTHLPFVENQEELDFILQHVRTDWIFWGFADELIPKKCLNLFKKVSQEDKYKVVVQKRKTIIQDEKSEFFSTDVAIKFFKKGALDYNNNNIHQSGKFANNVKPHEVLYLPPLDEYCVYHFSHFSTDLQISHLLNYGFEEARTIVRKTKKITFLKHLFEPVKTFFIVYFITGAFRRGFKGLIISIHAFVFSFLVYSKAYEIQNNITNITLENKFTAFKKLLLKQSPESSLLKKIWANLYIVFVSFLHRRVKFSQK